jgi:hypothetical protein
MLQLTAAPGQQEQIHVVKPLHSLGRGFVEGSGVMFYIPNPYVAAMWHLHHHLCSDYKDTLAMA